MEELLQEVLKKIDSLNSTLQELLKATKTDNGSIISAILGIENKLLELRNTTSEKALRTEDDVVIIHEEENFAADIQSIHQRATKIRRNIISVWKKSLNERKQAYWNYLRSDKTANIYVEWLEKENPVLPRKFRPRTITGEHEDDRQIRRDTAISAFKAEIRIIKNRTERYRTAYVKVDSEMSEIFEKRSGHNDEIRDRLNMMWKKECSNEEERSESIWAKTQDWLTNYESRFGSELFINEPNHEPMSSGFRRNQLDDRSHRNATSTTVEQRRTTSTNRSAQSNTGNHGYSRNNNQRERNANYRNNNYNRGYQRPHANNARPYNGQQTFQNRQNSGPVQRNGTTYIGRNVRASFLERTPYDKDGGSGHTDETRPKTIQ